MVPKYSLSYSHQRQTFADPVKEIWYFEAAFQADWILRWIKLVEVLPEEGKIVLSSWYEVMVVRQHWRFRFVSSAQRVIPGTVVAIRPL